VLSRIVEPPVGDHASVVRVARPAVDIDERIDVVQGRWSDA
jgi:hypothetical protein